VLLVFLDQMELLALRVNLEQLEHLEQWENKELKAPPGRLDLVDHKVQLVH